MAYGEEEPILYLPNSVMRERATPGSTSRENLRYVTGWMIPNGYTDNMPDGRRVAQFSSKDVERVNDGYACGECYATFERRFTTCPGCGHELDANRDIVEWMPQYWLPSPATVTNTDWD